MNQSVVPTTYQGALILGRTPKDAVAELKRRQRAGEVASAGPVQLVTRGAHAGRYAIPATIIVKAPDETRLYRRLITVGSVLMALAALLGLGWWAAVSLTFSSFAALCFALVAGLYLRIRLVHGGRRVTVTTRVEVQ